MQRRAVAAYVAVLLAAVVAAGYAIWSGQAAAMKQPEHMEAKAWAIGGMAGLTAVLLLASGYMPVRGD